MMTQRDPVDAQSKGGSTCRRFSSPLSSLTEDSFSRRYASRSSSVRPTGPNHVLSRNTCEAVTPVVPHLEFEQQDSPMQWPPDPAREFVALLAYKPVRAVADRTRALTMSSRNSVTMMGNVRLKSKILPGSAAAGMAMIILATNAAAAGFTAAGSSIALHCE